MGRGTPGGLSPLLLLLICTVCGPVRADESPIDLAPVQVTWQRPTLLESEAPVLVIEPTDEDTRAGRTVADLLEAAAGFQILRSGADGQAQKVTLRGGNSRQVAVLLEGIPVADPDTATADLSLLPLSAVEAIEVYRGSTGGQAGSGAQGGAVVVRLRRGGRTEFAEQSGLSGYTSGPPDGARVGFTARHKGLFLHYAHDSRQGSFPFTDTNGASRERSNNRSSSDRLAATWRWRPARGVKVELLGSLGLIARGSPGLEQFPSEDASENRQQFLVGSQLDVRRFLFDGSRLRAGLSHGLWQFHFVDPTPYIGPQVNNQGVSQRTRLTLGWTVRALPWLSIDAQGSESLEWMERTGSEPIANKTRSLADGDLSLRLGKDTFPLSGSLGLGLFLLGTDHLRWLPNAAATWRIAAPLAITLSGGRTYRAPAFDELYFSASGIRGNPDLLPEETWNAGLDLETTWGPLRGTLSGYYQRYGESILFLPVSPYLVEAQNTGAIDVMGAEAGVALQWAPVTITGSLAWVDAQFADSGRQLPFKSPFSASLGTRVRWRWLTGYVKGLYRSPFTLDRFESKEEEWRLLIDAGLAASLGRGFQIAVDARNLLNKQDRIDAFQHPLPGLSWHVSLQHRWQGGNQ